LKRPAQTQLPNCTGKRFALVVARFYHDIADLLVEGARSALRECGVSESDISVYDVPGCFEIPLACRKVIESRRVDGVVALGAVVRGETAHFDYVAGECARGIMDVQLATEVPIGFGVLTTDTIEQARVRADPQRGNKGYDAARAAAQLAAICG
jgi:6,7-dimethyl-8-ribityllumazine synthase